MTTEKVISIAKVTSTITGVVAVVGIMWGIFRFIDTANRTAQQSREMAQKIDSLAQKIDGVAMQGYRLARMLSDIDVKLAEQGDKDAKYQRSYIQYVRNNTKTAEELFKYLEGLDLEKKN